MFSHISDNPGLRFYGKAYASSGYNWLVSTAFSIMASICLTSTALSSLGWLSNCFAMIENRLFLRP